MLGDIYKVHKNELSNLDVAHPKVMICMAGAPGSGKSHLAGYLSERYQGIVLSNDRVRRIIEGLNPNLSVAQTQPIVQDYLAYFLDKIQDSPNGLLILDSAIDRKYQKVFEEADRRGYKKLVIDFDVPKADLGAAIRAKKPNSEDFMIHLDRWIDEHEHFKKNVTANIVLSQGSSYDEVDTKLQELIKER